MKYPLISLPVLLIFISSQLRVTSSDLLGNILKCSPSARYVLHECYQTYEQERAEFEFGHANCCIYAKYVACLKEKMDIWCRRSIQQLVDATVGQAVLYDPKDPKGCQGTYYPSAKCALLFNLRLILAVASLVGIAIGLAFVICCCHICCRKCRCKKTKEPE